MEALAGKHVIPTDLFGLFRRDDRVGGGGADGRNFRRQQLFNLAAHQILMRVNFGNDRVQLGGVSAVHRVLFVLGKLLIRFGGNLPRLGIVARQRMNIAARLHDVLMHSRPLRIADAGICRVDGLRQRGQFIDAMIGLGHGQDGRDGIPRGKRSLLFCEIVLLFLHNDRKFGRAVKNGALVFEEEIDLVLIFLPIQQAFFLPNKRVQKRHVIARLAEQHGKEALALVQHSLARIRLSSKIIALKRGVVLTADYNQTLDFLAKTRLVIGDVHQVPYFSRRVTGVSHQLIAGMWLNLHDGLVIFRLF